MNAKKIFVTGTDTEIGKTVLSWSIMNHLFLHGKTPFYIKPFQTGCRDVYDTDSDSKFVYENTSFLKGQDPVQSTICCYQNPKAPWFAARDENTVVDINIVNKFISEKEDEYSHLLLEGAGGALVPITKDLLAVDFIKDMDAMVVLGARAGLGTINHTLLSIEAYRLRGIELYGVVLINNSKDFPQSKIEENIEAIEKFGDVKVITVINRLDEFSLDTATTISNSFGSHFL